ncbi:MAG: binding-protein-dependent transport system inner rane component [Devosia sp.]|nr:binding-protein-dependent transport system inner rane component [Devosia sp.]
MRAATRLAPLGLPRARADVATGSGAGGNETLVSSLFLAPALFAYGLFVLLPLLHTIWLSLFEWDGVSEQKFIGLDNYLEIVTNAQLAGAFLHSAVLILLYAGVAIGLALLVVAAISRSALGASGLYRTLLFLPQVVPTVVVGISWRWILAPEGLLNSLLDRLGLGFLTRSWLADFDTALIALGLVGAWQLYGLFMLMFIAGVQKISPSLYEAARLDGAGPVQEFFSVTLPGLRQELVLAVMLATIAAISSFDLIYTTTRGGPGTSTTVPALEVYRRAFAYADAGSAAAVGTVIAAIVLALVVLLGRVTRERRES